MKAKLIIHLAVDTMPKRGYQCHMLYYTPSDYYGKKFKTNTKEAIKIASLFTEQGLSDYPGGQYASEGYLAEVLGLSESETREFLRAANKAASHIDGEIHLVDMTGLFS